MTGIIVHGCNGRMGQTVVKVIQETEGYRVVAGVDPSESPVAGDTFSVYPTLSDVTKDADAVVDFSVPEALGQLLEGSVTKRLPLVIATSGFDSAQERKIENAAQTVPILRASNLSIGITLLKMFVRQATTTLGNSFDVEIVERYHRLKKDAPSGTSRAFADVVLGARNTEMTVVNGREGRDSKRSDNEIGIHSVRGGSFVGEHDIIFAGSDEVITLSHTAFSRRLFVTGALKAATFLIGRSPGLYGMEDMLDV